jgi:hypothetical protein
MVIYDVPNSFVFVELHSTPKGVGRTEILQRHLYIIIVIIIFHTHINYLAQNKYL